MEANPSVVMHDQEYPRMGADESHINYIRRALTEHRQSHVLARDHLREQPDCPQCASSCIDADYQQRAVERYDELLDSLSKIESSLQNLVDQVEENGCPCPGNDDQDGHSSDCAFWHARNLLRRDP